MAETIRDAASNSRYSKATREAAGRLAAMGYGDVGIRSGYRSPSKNRAVGGAKNSAHMRGAAFDIAGATSWSPAQREAFHMAAAAAGFKGHGFYGTGAVHIDTENKRSWGPNKASKWAQKVMAAIGKPFTPKTDQFPDAPPVPTQSPALAYLRPEAQALPPTPPASLSAPQAPSMAMAPTNSSVPALRAIEAIAPTPPSGSIVGQPTDMSRYAPQSPFGAEMMASAQAPYGALGVDPNDTNFGGINPTSMPGFGGTFPGVSMPATPSGPTGAETLLAKAQAPSAQGIATPETAAQTQITPGLGLENLVSRPPSVPSNLFNPTSLATAQPSLTAPNFNAMLPGNMQQSMPMGMIQPGIGALPQAPVLPQQAPVPPSSLTNPYPNAPVIANPFNDPRAVPMGGFPAGDVNEGMGVPSSLTVGDVYGGAIGSAQSGDNTISRDAQGITSVTNKFGVTTGMMPDGKQTAYGPSPALGNLFGGVKMSDKTKGMLAGAALGALAGGLPGAVAGGLFGRALSNNRNSFPTAPGRHGERNGVPGGDRTHAERASRSPSAADHVSRGGGMTGLW